MNTSDKLKRLIKKKIMKKLLYSSALNFFLPMLLVSCILLIVAGSIGGDNVKLLRMVEIPGDYLIMAKEAADNEGVDFIKLLVRSFNEAGGDKDNYDESTLQVAMSEIEEPLDPDSNDEMIYEIYTKIYGELQTHPIPKLKRTIYKYRSGGKGKWKTREEVEYWRYTHYEDFGDDRFYEGERVHYGNDVVADRDTPIVSMTDGVITNLGWNELGGWRVGITDANSTYWYYAHMDHYEDDIYEGQYVQAGDCIGYVGDSGYGPPGTTGKFITHVHVQIGITMEDMESDDDSGYIWINPYPLIEFMEANRIELEETILEDD